MSAQIDAWMTTTALPAGKGHVVLNSAEDAARTRCGAPLDGPLRPTEPADGYCNACSAYVPEHGPYFVSGLRGECGRWEIYAVDEWRLENDVLTLHGDDVIVLSLLSDWDLLYVTCGSQQACDDARCCLSIPGRFVRELTVPGHA